MLDKRLVRSYRYSLLLELAISTALGMFIFRKVSRAMVKALM
eukprot:COSAG01_NODE_47138_length_393_cov_0.880952_1_plen_41_part_10